METKNFAKICRKSNVFAINLVSVYVFAQKIKSTVFYRSFGEEKKNFVKNFRKNFENKFLQKYETQTLMETLNVALLLLFLLLYVRLLILLTASHGHFNTKDKFLMENVSQDTQGFYVH